MFIKLMTNSGKILGIVNRDKLSSIIIECSKFNKKTYVVFKVENNENHRKYFHTCKDAEEYINDVSKNLEKGILYVDMEEYAKFW